MEEAAPKPKRAVSSLCCLCNNRKAALKRPKTLQQICRECFYEVFEEEIHQVIVKNQLFRPGERIAVGASGGKDSTVLAYVLSELNQRHNYGLDLFLLSVDEGITGYRDDSLETVKRNEIQYGLPLQIVSYKDLYGWTMDEIVKMIGLKNNCTFCGVFRRQALDRGAALLKVDKLATGHNADDMAETVLLNILRGDIARLSRCTAIITGEDGPIPRCKPFKYTYEKEISHSFRASLASCSIQFDYWLMLVVNLNNRCSRIYSPNAYRGFAREFIKDLERIRPRAILDIIKSGEDFRISTSTKMPEQGTCERCGYISSQKWCKACVLLEGLNRGLPKLGIGRSRGLDSEGKRETIGSNNFQNFHESTLEGKGILINGQFPGPDIHSVTNDNIIINVFNSLDEPFLLSWNGIQQRRNSYEDGVYGTTCPIPPGKNFTYILQMKDQIGSFYYFPSLGFHKAAGGFGGIRILSRPRIPVPFPDPAGDYTVLIGDWYQANHTTLRAQLDNGSMLPLPDGILINGRGPNRTASINVEQGKTYRLRISNVGLQSSLNFRIQGHRMKVVEVEGTHTLQTEFSSLDIHVGQSYSVLVTADQPAQDFYIVVSSRFTTPILSTTAILRYANSAGSVQGPPPGGPTIQIDWSLNQARAIRTNLTASGPRPNPQGSYHYGMITTTRTIVVANSAGIVDGKQRYAVNSVSFIPADTPLKVADFFKIGGVFRVGSISDWPNGGGIYQDTSVMGADYRAFVEIVFQNNEDLIQSWHLDGYSFFVVGMDGGQWTSNSRNQYNLRDAIARCTVQVYPKSWSAIYVALDNVGMWNIRTEFWARQYLGQQFYLRVYTPSTSLRDEYPIPKNALLCGRATGRRTRPL
ncbi:hypothetical protein Csa_018735 [Cucumis sativus]|nr:hypothetical protein Csa_018735 [Cucumis sativus]